MASVDGVPITRDGYAAYEAVFVAPDGSLTASREQILLSLINQVLVVREAERRGLDVSDEAIDEAEAGAESVALLKESLRKRGDRDSFRQRIRMFLLFRVVKATVVGEVEPSIGALKAEYEADPRLAAVGLEQALPELRERVTVRETERRWADWLHRQRECADIRVLDSSLLLASATAQPHCSAP